MAHGKNGHHDEDFGLSIHKPDWVHPERTAAVCIGELDFYGFSGAVSTQELTPVHAELTVLRVDCQGTRIDQSS